MLALIDSESHRRRVVAFQPSYEAFVAIPQVISNLPTIFLDTDSNFYPIPSTFKKLLEERDDIAVVIINSPNNPTGAVYPIEILKELSDILKQYPHIAVISDEVYRVLNYTTEEFKYETIAKFLPDQTIYVGGMSKEVSGTGLRLGFAAGPAHVIHAMSVLTAHTNSCVNYPVQIGLLKFLHHDSTLSERLSIRSILNERRKLIQELFSSLPALKNCVLGKPTGAFYLFPKIDYYYGHISQNGDHIINNDVAFCKYLLIEGKVVTIPGSKFNRPGYIRIAYASCMDNKIIEHGICSMNNALLLLKRLTE